MPITCNGTMWPEQVATWTREDLDTEQLEDQLPTSKLFEMSFRIFRPETEERGQLAVVAMDLGCPRQHLTGYNSLRSALPSLADDKTASTSSRWSPATVTVLPARTLPWWFGYWGWIRICLKCFCEYPQHQKIPPTGSTTLRFWLSA